MCDCTDIFDERDQCTYPITQEDMLCDECRRMDHRHDPARFRQLFGGRVTQNER